MPVALREYQKRIAAVGVESNTIVLLPTGAGKTYIAAEIIHRLNSSALFLVPTIPLVSQQAAAIRSRLGKEKIVEEFHGQKQVPRTNFNVLVTTPKAFDMAQTRGEKLLSWEYFSIVIFDEVHHVIKDHPYRVLAHKLKQSGCKPRVIGLTASLTYSVGAGKIAKSVDKLCTDLQISCIEHAEDKELREGGYKGSGRASVAELRLPTMEPDKNIVPLTDRKPHLMYDTFFERINKSKATHFGHNLLQVIRCLEKVVYDADANFISPLKSNSLKTWGKYANGRISVTAHYDHLQHWYEALRLLITSWEEGKDAVLMLLKMMDCHDSSSWPTKAKIMIDEFFMNQPKSSTRFENMYEVFNEKVNEGSEFRGLLFVQQRIMTHILKYAIDHHELLSKQIQAKCLYATSTPASSVLSVSNLEAREALRAFSTGEANLLITTSVAEEGLDIPEANCVVYFDPMNHAVSYVQGRGRARQANSSFVMLNQRVDRPAVLLAQQEAEQHSIASSFSPKKHLAGGREDLEAQKNRERNAACLLNDITEESALSKLNTFCKKTKVVCDEKVSLEQHEKCYKMTYKSSLREVSAVAHALNKKTAKRKVAVKLLRALENSMNKK